MSRDIAQPRTRTPLAPLKIKSTEPVNHEYHLRIIAYLTLAAATVIAINDNLVPGWAAIVMGFALVYPHVVNMLSAPFRETHAARINFGLILLDGLFFGAIIVMLGTQPIPTMLMVIMANASFITRGSKIFWFFGILLMGIGAAATWYAMDFYGLAQASKTSEWVNYAFVVGVGAYVAMKSIYSNQQTQLLQKTSEVVELQREKYRGLSIKLSRYVSPQVWQIIFSGKKDVKLETQRKKLVVFFSDIKGFTSLSEEIEPEELTALLNNYLTEMSKIVLQHGGTIDKFIGDSVMVFFGDPETKGTKKDAIACVSMAIEMRRHMIVLQQRWRSQGIKTPLEIRMGINTGFCTVGNFGAENRMDYTIIGKEVNLASRLESASEPSEILISYETYSLVKEIISCRERGQIQVKGFSKPITVYQVVDFRRDLGATQTFTEHQFDGFTLQVDLAKVKNYDKEQIIAALDKAHKTIDKKHF